VEIVEQKTKKNRRSWGLGLRAKNAFGKVFGSRGRKIALLTGLLALLVVTGYLNFTLNQNAVNVNANTKTETDLIAYFKDERASTSQARKLLLEDIIANASASSQAKAAAEAELLELATNMAFITQAEGLLMTDTTLQLKNVVVSKSGQKINVVVKKDGVLSAENVAKIQKIVASVMKKDRLEPENGDSLFISQM
jgi:cytoskeletal protein RodZ